MPKFHKSSKSKLFLVKSEISDFFYKSSVNIALEAALETPTFSQFKNTVEDGLVKQFSTFSSPKTIDNVCSNIRKIDDRDLFLAVSSYLISFDESIPGGEKVLYLYLLWASQIGGSSALEKLKIANTEFYSDSKFSQALLASRLSFLVPEINNTSATWIATTISQGIKSGLNSREIALKINDSIAEVASYRSGIIAETELAQMIGEFTVETFKNNGIKNHIWITSKDERTCPSCMGNEQQGEVEVGKSFISGVTHAPAHIGCRCFTIPKGEFSSGKVWRG